MDEEELRNKAENLLTPEVSASEEIWQSSLWRRTAEMKSPKVFLKQRDYNSVIARRPLVNAWCGDGTLILRRLRRLLLSWRVFNPDTRSCYRAIRAYTGRLVEEVERNHAGGHLGRNCP